MTQGQEGRSSQSRGGGNPIEAQTCQGARPGPERPPACVKDRGRTLGSTPGRQNHWPTGSRRYRPPELCVECAPPSKGHSLLPAIRGCSSPRASVPLSGPSLSTPPFPAGLPAGRAGVPAPPPAAPPSPWGPLAEPARHLVARLWNCREVAQATAPAPGSGKGRPEPKNGGPLGAGLGSCPKPVLWE